jgi:hypothetical protein
MISQMIVVQKYISIEEHPVGITDRFPLPAFPKNGSFQYILVLVFVNTTTC